MSTLSKQWLWLLTFLLFIVQSTWVSWLIPESWQKQVYVAPHFTLIVTLFIGLFLHRHSALVYGLVFGLLQDFIFYGHMLGIYSFGMGLAGYLAGLMQRRQPNLLFYNMLIIGLGELLFELINYGLNRLFNTIHTDFQQAFTYYMLPSVLFNLLFALVIYVPIRKILEAGASQPEGEAD